MTKKVEDEVEIPSVFMGESRTRLLQGIALGAVATMLIGFNWGGWMLGSTAQSLAQSSATSAVVTALVPICVAQFQQGSDAPAKLVELRKANSWEQSTFVEKGGWASMPGNGPGTVSGVAQACATALRDMK